MNGHSIERPRFSTARQWLKRVNLSLTVTFYIGSFLPLPAAEHHPRLFLNPQKIATIKAEIQRQGSHHAEAFGALKSWVDTHGRQPHDPSSGNWNYPRAYMARAAAFLHVITGREEYAELAFQVLKDVHDQPDPDRRLPDRLETYGLAKATVGEGFALAYDWCYQAWSPEQRAYVKNVLLRSLDLWPKYQHSQLQVERGSNWAAVCRGAELVMLLASYEDEIRTDRLAYLKRQLSRHMAICYGPGGLSQEGIGYTGYGGIYLLEACYALAETGDNTLIKQLNQHAFWKLQMFTGSSITGDHHQRCYLQQGVSGWSIGDEGWTSLTLRSVPKDALPNFVWFYDRHMGTRSPGLAQQKYDPQRAAWIWAILNYPTDIVGVSPTEKLGTSHFDTRTGGFFFRNRWHDENDILCSIYSDLANHKAWDQREATGIRLLAHGTSFFGGPGKSRDASQHSRLLVDGKADAGKQSGKNGKTVLAEATDRGGYVITGGGSTYTSLGVEDLERHFLVDFSSKKNAAIISTLDRVKSSQLHTYTWNANLGNEKTDDNIEIVEGIEDERLTFLLEGKNGWVKGWVLHPLAPELHAGDPLQITTRGTDADIWLVMFVGSGRVPIGIVTGMELETTIQIGTAKLSFDEVRNRITLSDSQGSH